MQKPADLSTIAEGTEISYGNLGYDLVVVIHPRGKNPDNLKMASLWYHGHIFFPESPIQKVAGTFEDFLENRIWFMHHSPIEYNKSHINGQIIYTLKENGYMDLWCAIFPAAHLF